jgi:hypothetical protein
MLLRHLQMLVLLFLFKLLQTCAFLISVRRTRQASTGFHPIREIHCPKLTSDSLRFPQYFVLVTWWHRWDSSVVYFSESAVHLSPPATIVLVHKAGWAEKCCINRLRIETQVSTKNYRENSWYLRLRDTPWSGNAPQYWNRCGCK